MTDEIITISAGAPASELTPGVYEVTLVEISEPRTIFPQSGPNAGKEVALRDWTFALEDGHIEVYSRFRLDDYCSFILFTLDYCC